MRCESDRFAAATSVRCIGRMADDSIHSTTTAVPLTVTINMLPWPPTVS